MVWAGKRAQAPHQAHPHIGFPFASVPSLASRLTSRGWRAHKGFLHRTAQHLAALWQDGQHRQADTALVLAHCRPGPDPWFWDDGSSPPQSCLVPTEPPTWFQSVRASVANAAASVRELVTSSSSSSRDTAIVSFHVCMWAGKEAEAFSAMRLAAFTARAVRRISMSLLDPKVFFAQHSGFRISCVFIFLF
jgi:hypothetical protein